MDQIQIRELEVFGRHGVYPEENKLGQKFFVNAVLYTDTRQAGLSDDLTKSIHYGEVCYFITEYMKNHTFQLIETVAERLAEELLLHITRLQQVELQIIKPWAPIGLPLRDVSVKIKRGWHKAYIAFGSNMGEREANIKGGLKELQALRGCRIDKVSDYHITKPYGGVQQADFINGCLVLSTILTPQELLEELAKIEARAGRERSVRWGPRTLDLDIIFYDQLVVHDENLIIPHIDLHNRDFVLVPLLELNPNLFHPLLNQTVTQLWQELEKSVK